MFLFLYVHYKKYRMRPTSKWEMSLHEDLKSVTFKKEVLISSKFGQYRVNLTSRIEFVSSESYKFLQNTNLFFFIACIYDATCHFCNCTCYCTKDNMLRTSNHCELGDLRSEGIYFKNKYAFMTLKITLMPRIKEAFVWFNVKSTLQYPFEYCSDVSFIGTIFSRNWHLLFVLTLLISDFYVCILAALIIGICSTCYFEDHFRIMSENNCSHKNVLLIIKHIWRTNWITSGQDTTVC